MYDVVFDGGGDYSFGQCEVLTFDTHGVFTADRGDVGRWSKNIKLAFTKDSEFSIGTHTGKFQSDLGSDGPGFQGDEVVNGFGGVGPMRLYDGNDPVGLGTC